MAQLSFPYKDLAKISDTCTLPDGRKIGYAWYGNKDGPQIFYMHGLPGSRFEGKAFYERHLDEFGAGLIAVERPGIGLSSPHPGGTISDFASDVLHLSKHLHLKEWRVVAVSGGAPYAFACARYHPPESLRGVAICAGIGPYSFGYHEMGYGTKAMLLMFRFAPWLCHITTRPYFALQNMMSDNKLVETMQKNFSEPNKLMQIQEADVEIFNDRDVLFAIIASTKEHFRQGFGGHMQDGRCIANDWDFRITDIASRPIHLWHGSKDLNCPLHMAEKIAEVIGDGVRLHVVDETHLGSSLNCAAPILRDLLKTD